MSLQIIRNGITKMKVDEIVNTANTSLLDGSVDRAILRAVGAQLLEEWQILYDSNNGSGKITKAYRLPCKYVINTVGQGIWLSIRCLISCQ